MNRSRRRLIAGLGATAIASGAGWMGWRGAKTPHIAPAPAPVPPDPLFPHPLRGPGSDGFFGLADLGQSLTIVSAPVRESILAGRKIDMLGYQVEYGGRRFVNPVLRVATGTHLRVHYWNALDETSIVHWHGLTVDTNNDGHPHYAVGAGATYDYQFTVSNRAGTYWYHPHPHHLAGKQAYLGLAGVLLVEDAEHRAFTRALDLELGVTDIPILIQDKRVNEDGSFSYDHGARERFAGFCGDSVLLNWTRSPCLDCATRLYRFRLINGSNARIYRLAFLHGDAAVPFHVIGTDGGLLDRPWSAREIFLSPGERAEVLLDLSAAQPGDRLVMASLPFDAMDFGSGHGSAAPAASAVNGAPLDLMLLRVTQRVEARAGVPATLSRLDLPSAEGAARRRFTFDHVKGLWRINGQSYRMTETAFSVQRGAREIWEFRNERPAMPHPVHVHGFQYRVLERNGSPAAVRALAVDGRGLPPHELGWKDSVLVWPGETVRLLIDFSHPFPGDQVYMLQCHNLEHETHGMMVNFRVEA